MHPSLHRGHEWPSQCFKSPSARRSITKALPFMLASMWTGRPHRAFLLSNFLTCSSWRTYSTLLWTGFAFWITFIKLRAFPLLGAGQGLGLFFTAFINFFGMAMQKGPIDQTSTNLIHRSEPPGQWDSRGDCGMNASTTVLHLHASKTWISVALMRKEIEV